MWGRKVIVGVIYNDDSIWSDPKAIGHGGLPGGWNRGKVKQAWRYNRGNGVLYWWGRDADYEPTTEVDRENVEFHLEKKYGVRVKRHQMIDVDDSSYALSHEMEEGIIRENLAALSALKKKLIIVGLITDDDEVYSSDSVPGHARLLDRIPGVSRGTGKNQWRFRKDLETLYWWENPSQFEKDLVADHIKNKYGLDIARNAWMNEADWEDEKKQAAFNTLYNKAHGVEEGIKENMKRLLMEGIKEKAAEDFIRQTIKGSEWEGKVFVAGGYVRDEFMGKDPKDLDLLVNKPNGGIEFANWITNKIGAHSEGNPVTFPRFGTAKFNLRGITHNGIDISNMDIEAVMPRKEQYTAGSRKPDVSAGELKDDVERRDFTVNSLLKDLSSGEILDLTGMGKADIKAGIVRTPLSPDKIFTDDPLRMLRAIRFAIKYDWKLPMFMVRGLKKNASQLKNISHERIRDELDKMLMTGSPDRAVKLMKVVGLLPFVIPELQTAVGMTQNIHHKHDVFKHTLQVLKATQPVLIERMAALLHDIGKVVTRSVTPTGVHFYRHEDEGEKIAEEVMRRLKYPIEMINAVKKIVRNHMRLKQIGDVDINISDKALRKLKFDLGDELENALNVIHADNIAHADASAMPNQIANVRKRLDSLKAVATKPKLPVNGNDLIQMGFKQGPIFKDILAAITEAWFENPNITREDALKIVEKFKK